MAFTQHSKGSKYISPHKYIPCIHYDESVTKGLDPIDHVHAPWRDIMKYSHGYSDAAVSVSGTIKFFIWNAPQAIYFNLHETSILKM
jgi:hypothetical protein